MPGGDGCHDGFRNRPSEAPMKGYDKDKHSARFSRITSIVSAWVITTTTVGVWPVPEQSISGVAGLIQDLCNSLEIRGYRSVQRSGRLSGRYRFRGIFARGHRTLRGGLRRRARQEVADLLTQRVGDRKQQTAYRAPNRVRQTTGTSTARCGIRDRRER